MEPALQHVKTGYLKIYQYVKEMRRWNPEVERNEGALKYGEAHRMFEEEARLLAAKLENKTEELDGWCKICEGMHGKMISEEEENEIKELLSLIWGR